jgi:hypothetical protein
MFKPVKFSSFIACLFFSAIVHSQTDSNFTGCSISGATLPDLLKVEDDISQYGPRLEDVQLVVLKNQRKAVVFSIRNPPVNGAFQLWDVRYKVTWQDSCGRLLPDVSNSIDGFVLNPNDVRNLEVVAFDIRATRAILKVYIE